jgi:hypothetical protein
VGDQKWDTEYADYREWQGIITVEIPIAMRAMSGREKHTDPVEQAGWITEALTRWMRDANQGADDIQTGEARLVAHREEPL